MYGDIGRRLFSEDPEQDRQHYGNDNGRSQGKVKLKIFSLEDKITRQPTHIQFLQQWPAKTKGDEGDANYNQ